MLTPALVYNPLYAPFDFLPLTRQAKTGVELDSDQFVGPGVDYMLPGHFLGL